jgi:hypothetical protein
MQDTFFAIHVCTSPCGNPDRASCGLPGRQKQFECEKKKKKKKKKKKAAMGRPRTYLQ